MNDKICPLLSIGEEGFIVCQGADCAWYVPPFTANQEGRCAVQALGVLPYLAEGVRRL